MQLVSAWQPEIDGALPWNGLFAMGGKLYGTTQRGGNAGCFRYLGCGTVFSVTPSGKENACSMCLRAPAAAKLRRQI